MKVKLSDYLEIVPKSSLYTLLQGVSAATKHMKNINSSIKKNFVKRKLIVDELSNWWDKIEKNLIVNKNLIND